MSRPFRKVARQESSESEQGPVTRPKIVFLIARLNVGGATLQTCILHERLAHIFRTRLVAGSLAQGEKDMSYVLASDRDVVRIPQMSREVAFWADFVAFWRILTFLRRERPEIVHTHTAKAGALGRVAAWLLGIPVIVHTYHGNVFHAYFGKVKNRMIVAIERLLGRISTRVITISESQRREICDQYGIVPPHKVAVVHYGFEFASISEAFRGEARRTFGFREDDFVVGWAGRMVAVKDVQLLGHVIRKTAEKRCRISFLVAGDGTERPQLEALIQGCSNVQLVGWQQDMAKFWSASDVALLTSRNEGTPTSLIEAMAAGLPIVATNVGGVQDLAVPPLRELPHQMGFEAANGFLTSRTPEALYYCVEHLSRNPEVAKRMAAAGRAFALETFSMTRLVDEMSELYRTLLSERSRGFSVATEASEPPPSGHAV